MPRTEQSTRASRADKSDHKRIPLHARRQTVWQSGHHIHTSRFESETACDRDRMNVDTVCPLTPPLSALPAELSASSQRSGQHLADEEVYNISSQLARTAKDHQWTYAERQALCFLKRFYRLNLPVLTKIMNLVFPAASNRFRPSMIQSQHCEMKAFRRPDSGRQEYASVWAKEFGELASTFAFCVAEIEVCAGTVDLVLERRGEDDEREARVAARLRREHTALFENHEFDASPETNVVAADGGFRQCTPASLLGSPRQSAGEGTNLVIPSLPEFFMMSGIDEPVRHRVIVTNALVGHSAEPTATSRETAALTITQPDNQTHASAAENTPPVLFRFASASSGGYNKIDRLRAGKFATILSYTVSKAPSLNDVLWDATLHLGRHMIPSPLVSTSISLSWVLFMAYKSQDDDDEKLIYLIDGEAAHRGTNIYYAKDVIHALRLNRMFQPEHILSASQSGSALKTCRYQGSAEYFVWGEVVQLALIAVVNPSVLAELAERDSSVARLLRLHHFENLGRMFKIAKALDRDNIYLDSQLGLAIAEVMLALGVGPFAKEEVISRLLYIILTDWHISVTGNQRSTEDGIQHFGARFCSVPSVWGQNHIALKVERAARAAVSSLAARGYAHR